MSAKKASSNLVWLDLETSGLKVEPCTILEIATIITDKDLNVLAEGPDLVVHQPEKVLEAMDEWCKKQHKISGLSDEVRRSTLSLEQAEQETKAFVATYCPPQACPLCGNSICFDRRFLIKYMPTLNAFLSYRNVDVSTIKELVHRWSPGDALEETKSSKHRALDDIRESIEELRHYRKAVFKE